MIETIDFITLPKSCMDKSTSRTDHPLLYRVTNAALGTIQRRKSSMCPDVQWRSCRESELQLAHHVGRFDGSRPPNVPELRSLAGEPAAQRVSACRGLITAGRSGRLVSAADWRPGRQRCHTKSAHFASTRFCRASSRCHVWPTHDAMRPPAQAKALSDVRPGSTRTVQHMSLACATVFRGMKSGQFTARYYYSSTAAPSQGYRNPAFQVRAADENDIAGIQVSSRSGFDDPAKLSASWNGTRLDRSISC